MIKNALFFMLFFMLPMQVQAQDTVAPLSMVKPAISDEKNKAYTEEAFDAYDACEQNYNYSRSYDCKCIATQLYKVRVETDSFFTREDILADSLSECKDTPKMAATHYNQCLSWSAAMRRNAVEFCECYGNVMAKNFNKGNFTSARAEEGIMSIAMTECNLAHPKDGKRVKALEKKQKNKFSNLFSIFED